MRTRRGKSALKRAQEFFRFGCAYRLYAHAFGDLGEVQYRPVQVELRFGLGACVFGADTLKSTLSTEYDALLKMIAVTLSFSRARVQSAWIVYIELPSPIRASTGRSGHAIATPMALGRAWPIAPPVSVMRSCRE